MRLPAFLCALLAFAASASTAAAGQAPNTGRPGSPCKPVPANDPPPAPDSSLDTFSLGPAAPAAYEIGSPLARPAAPRVLVLIHGGAWSVVGKRALQAQRPLARAWRRAGWETVSITYRGCRRSIGDVLRLYDLVRARAGAGVPICLLGQSAGGHLALTTAVRRRDVACVISLAGPSDLVNVRAQGRAQARGAGPAGLAQSTVWGANVARAVFGRGRLRAASPVFAAGRIRARVLAATSGDDILIPRAQDRNLIRALRRKRSGGYAVRHPLPRGREFFVHGTATKASLRALDRRIEALVAPFGPAPIAGDVPRAITPKLRYVLAP